MIRFIYFGLIVFLAFSCGDVCPSGKNTTELPAGFEEPVHGLITHSEWVYTSGNQEVDTLTALGIFRKSHIESDCSEREFGIRNFLWSMPDDCETKEVKIEIHSRNQLHFDMSSMGANPNCIDGDFDYDLGAGQFTSSPNRINDFITPTKIYDEVIVLPFHYRSQSEAFFYVPEDGIVGYTLETDTFKLKSLK